MTTSSANPLLKPLQIGRLTVPGRLYKSATSETRATDKGYVTDELLEFYEPMVAAGTPLIVTGNLFVSLQSKSAGRQAGIDSDDKKPGLRDWVQLAHSGGSLLVAQLNHGGRQMVGSSDPGKATVSASSVREPLYGTKPRPLRADEIPALVDTFAAAAARAQDVGFDGVQIHAAHGYLLGQFLTPHTNRRNDEYGGSLDNRMRLLREVFQAIRTRVGDDYPILLKMNGTDMLPLRKGATTPELIRVAKVMADAGIDAVEISRGHYESWPGMILGHYKGFISGQVKEGSGANMSRRRRMTMLALAPIIERAAEHLAPGGEGFNLAQAEQFTAQLDIPVICVGGFHTATGMQSAIETNQCDAVSAARAFIADPTCSKTSRRRCPEDRCADTATAASPASAENRSTATTTRSAPNGTSCFNVLRDFDEHAGPDHLGHLPRAPEGGSGARRCVRVLGGTARRDRQTSSACDGVQPVSLFGDQPRILACHPHSRHRRPIVLAARWAHRGADVEYGRRIPGAAAHARGVPRRTKLFEHVLGHQSGPRGGRWWTTGHDDTVGHRTILLVRRRRGVSGRTFRAFVHTRLGPALHAAGARDLRTYALLPLVVMAHTTFGVSHTNPPHRRYHGAVVFGTDTRAQVEDLIASPEVAAVVKDQHLTCTAVHAFGVDRTVPVIRVTAQAQE